LGHKAGLAGTADEISSQAIAIGYLNALNPYLWTSMLVYPLIALVVWPPSGYKARG
jgi:hypothetical protein